MTDGTNEQLQGVELSSRTIPVPQSISRDAQLALSGLVPHSLMPERFPEPDDRAGWLKLVEEKNRIFAEAFSVQFDDSGVISETLTLNGVRTYRTRPAEGGDRTGKRVCLDIHGGALLFMEGELCRLLGADACRKLDAEVYSVDYRMPPLFPYPTPLDDCVAVYRTILETHDPADVIVFGSSAGANLAAATVLRARDEGLPLPAALILCTPEIDLTESGDSFQTNRDIDLVLRKGMMEINRLYAAGHDLRHPYLSPLFGDFSKGYPPTFLQSGTRDLFLSNTVRMHRALLAAKVPVELHIGEAMPHGGFTYATPEDLDMAASMRAFADRYWPSPAA